MKHKLILIAVALGMGLLLTGASIGISQKTPLDADWCGGQGSQVSRGFPLRVIALRPSISLCQPVDSLLVLVQGNVDHTEYPLNAAVDFVFWCGVALAALLFTQKRKHIT